ncbi:hypothetical protein AAC387_Pa06g0462 [Persea americana]
MEAVHEAEWEEEGEEEGGSLKVRSRKSIIENLEANQGAVQVVGDSENGRNPEANEGAPVQVEVVRRLRELESCVYLDREKGIESADEITGTKFISVTLFTDEKKPANDEADFDTKNIEIQTGIPFVGDYGSPEHMKTENQSTFPMVFSEGQHEDGTAKFEPIMDRSSTNANGSLVDVGKIVVEMDFERVLEEQETHDLYCPNCNSCITKRVILRKRKRVVRDLKFDAKREKIQPLLLQSDDVETSPDASVANDLRHETGSDVFRCLSCFSFFIPTAAGFKLFPIFGRNNEIQSSQSPQQTPTKNLNCISYIFEMFTGKLTGNEPAVLVWCALGTSGIKLNDSTFVLCLVALNDVEETVQPLVASQDLDESENLLHKSTSTTTSIKGVHLPDKTSFVGEHVQDAVRKALQDNKNCKVLLMPGSSLLQETQTSDREKLGGEVEQNNTGSGTTQIESNRVNLTNPSSLLDGTLLEEKNYIVTSNPSAQCPQNIENDGARVKDLEKKPLEDDKNIPTSLTPEALVPGEALLHVGEKLVENDGARLKDLEKKPLEDDKNIRTSTTPEALVHGEALLCVGEKLVENDGTRVKDLEKKPLEDDKNIRTSTTPEALVHGEALLYVGEKWVENDGARVRDLEKKPLEDDKNILTSSTPEALVHGEALLYVGEKLVEPRKKSISDEKTGYISTNPNGDLLEEFHPSAGKQMNDPKPKPVEDQKTDLITSRPEALVIGKRKIDFEEILEDLPHAATVVGRISPETSGPSESKENVPTSVAPVLLEDTRIDMPKQRADDGTIHKWEILKSFVYGGLVESITSLGVVSSAAGSDATTLNIVALGVANLISGLIVILHSLRDLKNDQHSSIDQEGEKLDRYEATLGRRENFWLHATVSVLSYIMFGSLPPIIYGFTFRKSDNKEYKLIAVAAASLLCIILLAAGKAHVRKAPKNYIRTILYYIGIGVAASGLSYVVGVLFKKLLEKLGWFDSSAAATASSYLAFPETIAMNSRWASYW